MTKESGAIFAPDSLFIGLFLILFYCLLCLSIATSQYVIGPISGIANTISTQMAFVVSSMLRLRM